jgi:23S rRNA (cytidine1920-2'-O)/16S rRNA (cytidine1409-2'-O)-methyltransferase
MVRPQCFENKEDRALMLRLDKLLFERGLAESRTQARQLIEAGAVEHCSAGDWRVVNRASHKLPQDAELRVSEEQRPRYVSRAGLKLEKALSVANLCLDSLIALDVGQSTGGFTDCLIQHGCPRVIGLDVGHEQLHPRMRQHESVVSIEGLNARELLPAHVQAYAPEGFDLVVMDLSFISQSLVLPRLPALMKAGARLISLVKPQFEVGSEGIGKGGIVRDLALYPKVEAKICEQLQSLGFEAIEYFESPIEGGDGNREFFAIAQKP